MLDRVAVMDLSNHGLQGLIPLKLLQYKFVDNREILLIRTRGSCCPPTSASSAPA